VDITIGSQAVRKNQTMNQSERRNQTMKTKTMHLIFAAGLVLAGLMNPGFGLAGEKADLQAIVEKSARAVKTFKTQEDVSALLAKAHGVIVYPGITKAAIVVGGEGGTGVLLGRNDKGVWSSPAFITYGAASFGMQIGAESSSILMVVMNQKTMQSLVDSKVELGTNATLAAGKGIKGKLLSTDKLADIYYFALVKGGVFAGINLKGGVNETRDKLNRTYYDKEAPARAVVMERTVSSEGAAGLIKALSP
jgi:lipid-binding SYLF domain-containing protein